MAPDGNGEGQGGGSGSGSPGSGQPGADGGAAGGTGQGEGGAPPDGTQVLDRSKLNPLIQRMSEDQINDTVTMLLRASMEKEGSAGGNTTVAAPPPPPALPSADEMKDAFDPTSPNFNPVEMVKKITEANYSGLLSDISGRANGAMKMGLRDKLPDFVEHEGEIDTALKNVPPAQITQDLLFDTYLRVKGLKATAEMMKQRQAPPSTRPPTPKVEDGEPGGSTKLSAQEEAVAKDMFRGAADPIASYQKAKAMLDGGELKIKVPGDK